MDGGIATVGGIEIAYETFGARTDPPLLLVMGLGMQMLAWPDEMCEQFAERGHFVIRFDNRDVGLSTHLDGVRAPTYLQTLTRRKRPPYTIDDMADDTVGLLDWLGLGSAHLVGISMGGFIAQSVAVRQRSRVRSLTLIMTSTGSQLVGRPKTSVLLQLLRQEAAADRLSMQAAAVEAARLIGSRGYELDEAYLADLAGQSYDRSYDPGGYWRQLAAISAQHNRTRRLRQIRVPALVMHGLHDPLIGVSGGLAAAKQLRNAKFVAYSGMGHDLPRALWPEVVGEVTSLTSRVEADAALTY